MSLGLLGWRQATLGQEAETYKSKARQVKGRHGEDRKTETIWKGRHMKRESDSRKDEMITLEDLQNMKEKREEKCVPVGEKENFIFSLRSKYHSVHCDLKGHITQMALPVKMTFLQFLETRVLT